ncbi:MAG: WD40 repeat domain-containing protein [Mameliella sp.]|nr:WD40 repeat domain-containing protein [Phaeodactylibacter sp.]
MPHLFVEKINQLTGHNASIFALEKDQAANSFLSGAGDGWIVRWSLDGSDNGKLIAKVETQVFSLLHLPEQQIVVAGNMNGGVHWVDLEYPDQTRNIAHHQKGVFAIQAFDHFIFTAGGQGMLTKWDCATGKALESLQLSNQSLRSLAIAPEREEIAVGASDNSIYLLDANTLQIRHKIDAAHDNSVFSLAYSPDETYLLSGGRDAHLKAWGLKGEPVCIDQKPAHWFTINSIVFSPCGRWFATGSRDKTVKIWDAKTFELLKVLETIRDKGHLNSVNRLFWTPYQNYLISAGDDRSIIIWKVTPTNPSDS